MLTRIRSTIYDFIFASTPAEDQFHPHPDWLRINKENREKYKPAVTELTAIIADADLEQRDADENTPLTIAVLNDRVPVIKELLGRRANIEARGQFGFTPLAVAANFGLLEAAALLIEHH